MTRLFPQPKNVLCYEIHSWHFLGSHCPCPASYYPASLIKSIFQRRMSRSLSCSYYCVVITENFHQGYLIIIVVVCSQRHYPTPYLFICQTGNELCAVSIESAHLTDGSPWSPYNNMLCAKLKSCFIPVLFPQFLLLHPHNHFQLIIIQGVVVHVRSVIAVCVNVTKLVSVAWPNF